MPNNLTPNQMAERRRKNKAVLKVLGISLLCLLVLVAITESPWLILIGTGAMAVLITVRVLGRPALLARLAPRRILFIGLIVSAVVAVPIISHGSGESAGVSVVDPTANRNVASTPSATLAARRSPAASASGPAVSPLDRARENASARAEASKKAVDRQAAKELAAKKAAKEKAAKDKAAKEKAAKDKAAKEQAAKEEAAKEQAAKEQAAKEQAAREKAAREKAAKEQAAKEQAAKEKAAKEKAAKEKAAEKRAAQNCTGGYSPCLPPASDYDCSGGSGNGPEYVDGPVHVTGFDPYDLDRDGDGIGCDS